MNVKPGDLAYTVAPVRMEKRGHIYRVHRATTMRDHIRLNYGWTEGCWLCSNSSDGETIYMDLSLRPIRSDGITKEEVRELYEPQKQGKQVHLAAPNGPQGPVQAPQETA